MKHQENTSYSTTTNYRRRSYILVMVCHGGYLSSKMLYFYSDVIIDREGPLFNGYGLLAGRTIFVPFLTWFLNFYGFIQVTGFSFNQSKMSNKRKIRNTNISFLILLFQNFTFLKIELVLKPFPLRRVIKFLKTRRQVSIDLKA